MKEVRQDTLASYFRIGDGELDFPATRVIMLNGIYVAVEPKPGVETLLRVAAVPQRFGPPEFSYPEVPLSTDPGVIVGTFDGGHVAYLRRGAAVDQLFQLHSLVEHKQILAQMVGRFYPARSRSWRRPAGSKSPCGVTTKPARSWCTW